MSPEVAAKQSSEGPSEGGSSSKVTHGTVGMRPQLLTEWTLYRLWDLLPNMAASLPQGKSPKKEQSKMRATAVCSKYSTSAIFSWSHRPALIEYRKEIQKAVNKQNQDSMGVILVSTYCF